MQELRSIFGITMPIEALNVLQSTVLSLEQVREELRAISVRQWVLVPIHPTDEMNLAGEQVGDHPWDGKKSSRIYQAMLAAAPAPPSSE